MDRIKHILTQTRFPYFIVLLIIIIAIICLYPGLKSLNNTVNHQTVQKHIQTVRAIKQHRNDIFKYKAQLQLLSDQHTIYLFNHPKLKNHIRYMHLTRYTMKINNEDDTKIDRLQNKIRLDEDALPKEHPHYLSTNIWHHPSAKDSQQLNSLIRKGTAVIILGILGLIDIILIVKYNDKKDNDEANN